MVNKKKFNIVLIAPEIPGNTGSIGRTCVALGLRLILIKPYGFDLSEKAVRRAGLDYWKHVDITEYDTFDEFMDHEKPNLNQIFLLENSQKQNIYEAPFSEGCYLFFGSETKGIHKDILNKFPSQTFELPMFSQHIRSLNLSNTVTTVAYECLRSLNSI